MIAESNGKVTLIAMGDVGPIWEPVDPLIELAMPVLEQGDLRFGQCERVYSEELANEKRVPKSPSLFGGCTTPISALAELSNDTVLFRGNILSPDGTQKLETAVQVPVQESKGIGITAANQLLEQGAGEIVATIRNATHS